MSVATTGEVTELLGAVRAGQPEALDRLIERLYPRFHRLARQMLRQERADHSLQPTALLHEAFVRGLSSELFSTATNHTHLFASMARLMRRVLVDAARRRSAEKRGGGFTRLPFDVLLDYFERERIDVLALHDALETLAAQHERPALVLTLRIFGGCSVAEVAEQLGLSVSTVEKDTFFARAWLHLTLGEDRHEG